MSLIPRTTDDFFAPIFGGWPFEAGSLVPRAEGAGSGLRGMPVDIKETDKEISVLADLPGVKKEDIKVTVDGDVVRINVETKQAKEETKEEKGVKWHRYERSSSYMGRALRMPENADLDKLKAKLSEGVLQLEIPKKSGKEAGAKTITVS